MTKYEVYEWLNRPTKLTYDIKAKIRLAEECGFECPYTGQHFSMAQLLDGRTVEMVCEERAGNMASGDGQTRPF